MASSYRDLKVWQSAIDLAEMVYVVTANFPPSEIYGLTSNCAAQESRYHRTSPKAGVATAVKITGVSSLWHVGQTMNCKPNSSSLHG
jgi:23S rRNA-intervening sequence protein